MGLTPEFSAMTVLAIIVLAVLMFGIGYFMNKICYMSEEGKLRCEFNFNKHTDSSVLSAIKCSYYCCQFGSQSPKVISLKSWKYDDEMVSCLDFCKSGRSMCGKSSAIKITIEPNSNAEIERDSWLKIVESSGIKNANDYATLIKSDKCAPIGYIKGKILGFIPFGRKNTNPAALIFPENSVCKFYWLNGLGIHKHVSKKACSLKPGNYEIWTDSTKTKKSPCIGDIKECYNYNEDECSSHYKCEYGYNSQLSLYTCNPSGKRSCEDLYEENKGLSEDELKEKCEYEGCVWNKESKYDHYDVIICPEGKLSEGSGGGF